MKSKFSGKFRFEFLKVPIGEKWFRTTYPFAFYDKLGIEYLVPSGTNTDFASIPRGFRWIISRVGKHGMAAVLHDYLCESKIVPRKKADKILLEAMKVLGVGWLKRRTMYIAVRSYSIATFKK